MLCSPKYALSSENHIDRGDKISPRNCLTVCRVECWFPYSVNPRCLGEVVNRTWGQVSGSWATGWGVRKKPIDVNIVILIVSAVLDKHLLWARPLDP